VIQSRIHQKGWIRIQQKKGCIRIQHKNSAKSLDPDSAISLDLDSAKSPGPDANIDRNFKKIARSLI
jgi:hypothetical protein